MAKTPVFVSFDFDNDQKLRTFIVAQAKLPDSLFEIIDHSLKEAAPERHWEDKARRAIKRSKVVLVMVGPKTHKALGVLKEILIAHRAKKRVVQVIGYRDVSCKRVLGAGRLYRWNWENLKKILA